MAVVPSGTPVTNRTPVRSLSRGWHVLRKVLLAACAAIAAVVPTVAVVQQAGSVPAPRPAGPRAVAPVLTDLPLGAAPAGPRTRAAGPVTLSRTGTARFSALGLSWAADPAVGTVTARFRTRLGAGPWTAWSATESDDKEPDTRRGRRGGTEPVWTGPATGVEVQVEAGTGAAPRDLRLTLVDPGRSAADAEPVAGTLAAGRPTIYSRVQWGADPRLMGWDPTYSTSLKAGFLHHTVGTNAYSAADVPAILRSIYAFHSRTRGWGDIGYNFLVDRFGRTWEGRFGGVDSAVVAAHAGGFNSNTFGVAMIGTFQTAAVPGATVDAVSALFAWKLSRWNLDPYGTASLRSSGGGTSRYSAGTVVTKNVVSGHRDVGLTECPGDRGYATLATVRAKAKALMGAAPPPPPPPPPPPATPAVVDPAVSPTEVAYRAATGPRVTARLTGSTTWTVAVSRDCPAARIRTWSGTGTSVDTRWNLADDQGRPARSGTYTLSVFPRGTASGSGWSARVVVRPPTAVPAVPTGTLPAAGPAGLVPVTPVRVLDTRSGMPVGAGTRADVRVTGVGRVPATGVSAVVVSASGMCGSPAGPITVWPAGTARPGTTSVSVGSSGTDSALAVVRVGVGGRVSVAGGAGSADALLDVVGYLPTGGGAGLHQVTGTRVLDATLAPGATRTVAVPGGAAATAVLANVAAVTPTGMGSVRVWPTGGPKPAIASLGYVIGGVSSERVAAGVARGTVQVSNDGGTAVRVIVDVTGWYGGAGRRFTALTPARVATTTVPAGGEGTVVAVPGAPAGAAAVVVSLSARPTARTWFAAWGSGARPPTSDLHAEANTWETTLAVLPLAADGTVRLYSASAPATAVLDLVGYYR